MADKKRIYAIDAMRIISMLMIVMLHCIGHGGLASDLPQNQPKDAILWALRALCVPAVNLYALISGFVCVNTKHRWERLIELYLQVWVISVITGVVFFLLHRVSLKAFLLCFFPVLSNRYWYFSAYFLISISMPFLTHFSKNMEKRTFRNTLLAVMVILCCMGTASTFWGYDAFTANMGYSYLWLSALFLTGTYIREYWENFQHIQKWKYLLCFFGAVTIMFASRYVSLALPGTFAQSIGLQRILFSYMSPTTTIAAICLFLWSLQLQIKASKLLVTVSASTFGVYLLHDHFMIRENILSQLVSQIADLPWFYMTLLLVGIVAAIFVLCVGIDYLRQVVFRWMKVRTACEKTVSFFAKWIKKRLKD